MIDLVRDSNPFFLYLTPDFYLAMLLDQVWLLSVVVLLYDFYNSVYASDFVATIAC